MKLSVGIIGSTAHTVQCAEALTNDDRFTIAWVLTPTPRPIGRQQVLTKNPLHQFAEKNHIAVIHVDKKIDDTIKKEIESFERPDFILVVDFGYLIPNWLLNHPRIAPLNVHPSLLPTWRGSSPGQFVLLYGEKESAVTLMVMNEGMDTGPLVHQEYFDVAPYWTQEGYYQYSFDLMTKVLGDKMVALADKQITPVSQPVTSPTPTARRFTKQDGFVEWSLVKAAMENTAEDATIGNTSPLLQEVHDLHPWPQVLAQASRALNPWPTLWTIIPTTKGEKRMQILLAEVTPQGELQLEDVKIEGQATTKWSSIKNAVK